MLWPGAVLAVEEEARMLLEKMTNAMQTLNYRGTFVYQNGGSLKAMQIAHRFDKDGERERLIALTGEAREIIRTPSDVTCIWPGSKSVVVSSSRPRTGFPDLGATNLDRLEKNYQFRSLGEERVAGNMARQVIIESSDDKRYGYRLWLDNDSGLLLRSELVDEEGKAIEQVMFTDMQVVDAIDDTVFDVITRSQGFNHQRMDGGSTQKFDTRWAFEQLPKGFSVASDAYKMMKGDSMKVRHLVLSDGLASVSVYVEKMHASSADVFSGARRMGGANAYGMALAGYHFTVVGVVPAQTVKAIAEGITMQSSNS